MEKLRIVTVTLFLLIFVSTAHAWNLGPKYINTLSFKKSGIILFTLFQNGKRGAELKCNGRVWFQISSCSPNDAACISMVNRMGSMLLGAKLSGKSVYIQQSRCEVTEVALKH